MSEGYNELLRDPLFQLNVLLWLSQNLPAGYPIDPLFHTQGFEVYAIAPLLPLPPALQLLCQRQGMAVNNIGTRPDVILRNSTTKRYALIECKAASFGPSSSTANQGRTLLLASGAQSYLFLGVGQPDVQTAATIYFLPDDNTGAQLGTLRQLRQDMVNASVPVGPSWAMGIKSNSQLSITLDADGSDFFGLLTGDNPFCELEEGTDPRPLYLVPYDPDSEQSPNERKFSRRILFERIQAAFISRLGRVRPPDTVVYTSEELLNEATFGMFKVWDNRDAQKHMRNLCVQFMSPLMQHLNGVIAATMSREPNKTWKLNIPSNDQHGKLLAAVMSFAPETDVPETEVTQLSLFDKSDEP
jgi:hypothetical protein